MKNTKPRVATCNRCSQLVLACTADGFRTAVDTARLRFSDIREHLIAGRHVYRVRKDVSGLELITASMLKLPSARVGIYVASHGCGCHGMDSTIFEEPEAPHGPLVAVLDDQKGRSPVQAATNRTFRARCKLCDGIMESGDMFMIQWPVWTSVTHHTKSRGPIKGHERTFEGWGTETWQIHAAPDGCHTTTGKTR